MSVKSTFGVGTKPIVGQPIVKDPAPAPSVGFSPVVAIPQPVIAVPLQPAPIVFKGFSPVVIAPPAAPIENIKAAVIDIGARAAASVAVVRAAVASGTPPLQTAGSSSAADYISRFATGTGSLLIGSTARFGITTSVAGSISTPAKPEIDFIEVGNDANAGILDSFFARIVISVSEDDITRIDRIRVMRCSNEKLNVAAPSISALMYTTPKQQSRKSADTIANPAFRVAELGLGNKLTTFTADDQFSSQRVAVSSGTLRIPMPAVNTNRTGSPTPGSLLSIANVDRSVLENISFFTTTRAISPQPPISIPVTVAAKQGLNVLSGQSVSTANVGIVEIGNSGNFREIARIPIHSKVRVGKFFELEYTDNAVVYGASYSYYAICVDKDGIEGQRSRIVKADITSKIPPPESPEVLYSVISGLPRFSIRCSGSFLDHVEIFKNGGNAPTDINVLGSNSGISVSLQKSASTITNFFHIADVSLGHDRSNSFTDIGVSPGQDLKYRIYTVDSFGLKSQTPFSCSISIPDHGKKIPLHLPSITVERSGNRIFKVSIFCDDPRVSAFILQRKEIDVSFGYDIPTQPAYFTLGATTVKRSQSRNGPRLPEESNSAWSGMLIPVSGAASMNDTTVGLDRTYRYSVRVVDVKGNEGPEVFSQPLKMFLGKAPGSPVALSAMLVTNSKGTPIGTHISWTPDTSDFSPVDLIGNQSVLADSSVRSVYQVERRAVGLPTWEALPSVTSSNFVDTISTSTSPSFRPEYAAVAEQYDYRVIAMQSGGLLSVYSDPVRISTSPDIFPPDAIFVRSMPTSIRPLGIVISWNYDGDFVDGWQIERAVTNKVFGSKIFSMDSSEARSLAYENVAHIRRESSKAVSVSTGAQILDNKIFVGNRFFVDSDVDLVNSYYYRVCAVDAAGKTSDWMYGGISLTDSPHDRKFFSSISDDEKSSLAIEPAPVESWI